MAGLLFWCSRAAVSAASGDTPPAPAPATPAADAYQAQPPSPAGNGEPRMERVVGIGGFFFRSKDPKALARWYQAHLGIALTPRKHGDQPWQQDAGPTAFQPFSLKTDYFGSADKQWMINFRVSNLDALVRQLKASNIDVKVDPTAYPNGRFARLYDPEGNPIELWEPAGSPPPAK